MAIEMMLCLVFAISQPVLFLVYLRRRTPAGPRFRDLLLLPPTVAWFCLMWLESTIEPTDNIRIDLLFFPAFLILTAICDLFYVAIENRRLNPAR
jgi:hypothetical protein